MTRAPRDPAPGVPSLLRAAGATYARAVTRTLSAHGFDDVPRNGAYALIAVARNPSAEAVQRGLGVSKQVTSHLLDTLVLRGYLTRRPHPNDRRRTELMLTDRGHHATGAIRDAVAVVDHQLGHELTRRLPDTGLGVLRRALELLAALPPDTPPEPDSAPDREPDRDATRHARLAGVAPVLPVRDITDALTHYTTLGFTVELYPGGGYGFARRDGIDLHLHTVPDLNPDTNPTTVYLAVDDADDLADRWAHPGILGITEPPIDTDWHMREGTHRDPDGNLIRFGSPTHQP